MFLLSLPLIDQAASVEEVRKGFETTLYFFAGFCFYYDLWQYAHSSLAIFNAGVKHFFRCPGDANKCVTSRKKQLPGEMEIDLRAQRPALCQLLLKDDRILSASLALPHGASPAISLGVNTGSVVLPNGWI